MFIEVIFILYSQDNVQGNSFYLLIHFYEKKYFWIFNCINDLIESRTN